MFMKEIKNVKLGVVPKTMEVSVNSEVNTVHCSNYKYRAEVA